MLVTCIIVIMTTSIMRDGKIAGFKLNEKAVGKSKTAVTVSPMRKLADGSVIINTTNLGKDIYGYGGRVPLEITLKNGIVTNVKALKNSETSDFFSEASQLLSKWNGKTPEEALKMKTDGISGATFSSRAIIGNMKVAMQYADKNAEEQSFSGNIDLSAKSVAGLAVVLMAAIIPLFWKNRKYRMLQLILNVVVLGLWCGTFLSWSLLVNYMSNGINILASPVAVVMLITAIIYPLAGKKNYYCTNVCPFGSLQELAGRTKKKKWKMTHKTIKTLTLLRQILWIILVALMLTGIWIKWMDYELFTAFIFQSASVAVTVLAAMFIILSAFVPRPYCRFVCPTGTLFKLSQNQK